MADSNIYSFLDPKTPEALAHSLSFTVGKPDPGALLSVSSLILYMFLIADVGAAIAMVLYALGLRVGTFGEASDANITKSKKIITGALFALMFSFGLVLFAMAINPDMVTGTVDFTALTTTSSGGVQAAPTPAKPATQPSGNYAARVASHNAVVARLLPSGISTNHGNAPCTEAQFSETTPSCTSLAYLPEETIQLLLKIHGSCNCTFVISGGTEPGHKSHGENLRAVDLRLNNLSAGVTDTSDPLYQFIKTVGRQGTATNNCFMTFSWNSFTFCDERPGTNSTWNNHFHVS